MSAFLLVAALALPVNPQVTPDTIHSTICVSGWTKTVRPSVTYTNKIKRHLMDEAGIAWERDRELELDHHIPLTVGGAPSDPANLWLQAWEPTLEGWAGETGAKLKDKLEVRLNHAVCSGEIPLEDAQRCIFEDWRACAKRFPPKPDPQ